MTFHQKPKMHLIKLNGVSILEQLQLEEALLRADARNFCLINTGSAPAIVMGISGNFEKLVNKQKFKENPVPLIRRYSGGGTVFINEETFFVSFICNSEEMQVPSYPEPIFKWSEVIYRSVFSSFEFALKENDYVVKEKKFGGNAQYLQKNRWLHHTSFLYDYHPCQMDYLSLPEKIPSYRKSRAHKDFLCTLNTYFSSKDVLLDKVEHSLQTKFHVEKVNFLEIEPLLYKPHRKATLLIKD
ncbi:MAG TPA: lipoate--protein ligase family protein [Parachlamydiaceae bacterium]|nr:lipoate--protein ligase family protein [Parachlamydiaceae bacterium]